MYVYNKTIDMWKTAYYIVILSAATVIFTLRITRLDSLLFNSSEILFHKISQRLHLFKL